MLRVPQLESRCSGDKSGVSRVKGKRRSAGVTPRPCLPGPLFCLARHKGSTTSIFPTSRCPPWPPRGWAWAPRARHPRPLWLRRTLPLTRPTATSRFHRRVSPLRSSAGRSRSPGRGGSSSCWKPCSRSLGLWRTQGAVRRHHSRQRGQDPALSRQLHLDAAHGRPHALTAAMAPAALPRAHLHAPSRPSLGKRVQPRLGHGARCQTLPIGWRCGPRGAQPRVPRRPARPGLLHTPLPRPSPPRPSPPRFAWPRPSRPGLASPGHAQVRLAPLLPRPASPHLTSPRPTLPATHLCLRTGPRSHPLNLFHR